LLSPSATRTTNAGHANDGFLASLGLTTNEAHTNSEQNGSFLSIKHTKYNEVSREKAIFPPPHILFNWCVLWEEKLCNPDAWESTLKIKLNF
jgi:hypothetical protein